MVSLCFLVTCIIYKAEINEQKCISQERKPPNLLSKALYVFSSSSPPTSTNAHLLPRKPSVTGLSSSAFPLPNTV